MRNGKQVITN